MSNQSYIPPRLDNGQPNFSPMGPVTVNPSAPVAPTPYEAIRVPDQRASTTYINSTGQPTLTSGDFPNSRPSPALKPGR